MTPRVLTLPSLLLATLITIGCTNTPASPTEPGELVPASLAAEPALLTPEFLPSQACLLYPAFRVRLSVILRSGGTVVLSGLRFHFIDRSGSRTFPTVSVAPGASFASSLPSSSTVPIPGVAPLPPSFPTSGTLPFITTFACDVIADGTLVVVGDLDNGRTAEMRLRVGS